MTQYLIWQSDAGVLIEFDRAVVKFSPEELRRFIAALTNAADRADARIASTSATTL